MGISGNFLLCCLEFFQWPETLLSFRYTNSRTPLSHFPCSTWIYRWNSGVAHQGDLKVAHHPLTILACMPPNSKPVLLSLSPQWWEVGIPGQVDKVWYPSCDIICQTVRWWSLSIWNKIGWFRLNPGVHKEPGRPLWVLTGYLCSCSNRAE